MAANKIVSNCILLPLSKLYGMGMGIRNIMFKWHILKQRKFDVPVIVVGNIAVGGTGKTPHTEYIINLLKHNYHIGMISRGYKRKTKGFVLATSRTTPADLGDEPYQIYQKFGREISVAVCENRCEGIEELLRIDPDINLIVLDDAFQHRYVKPTVSIVLTEFNRPIFMDKLLPLGRLRESQKAIYRADFVVVTKCPERIKPLEYRILDNNLELYPYQKLFFSRYNYPALKPVFPEEAVSVPTLQWLDHNDAVLVVTGIANPRPLVKMIKRSHAAVRIKVFPDHHNFSRKDIHEIARRFEELEGDSKFILTTEKDAVRLANNPYFPKQLKSKIFYQPIVVEFDNLRPENFDYELKKIIADKIQAGK
ncbi:MAG: tetraacyldisaccharide 4'-kinase [Barnesiella sp.]|nr:tetraacyldisaccharide 4'-kinase [Barnesiella sp.]